MKKTRELYHPISKDDINLLADIITIAKYFSWDNEVGDTHAHELIRRIHARKYNSENGVWVQTGDMFVRIATFADTDMDAGILLESKYI